MEETNMCLPSDVKNIYYERVKLDRTLGDVLDEMDRLESVLNRIDKLVDRVGIENTLVSGYNALLLKYESLLDEAIHMEVN
jgi:hypothetical protein